MPGFTGGHVPAQGLHLLRGALERARHAAGGLARATSRVPLFLVEGIKRRLGLAARRARSRCSGWPSRPTPTTSATRCRTSSSACSSASWPTWRSTTRTCGRRRSPSTTRSSTPTRSSSPPTTTSSAGQELLGASPTREAATPSSSIRGTASAPRRSSPTRRGTSCWPGRRRAPRPGCPDMTGPRHRRRRHDRRRGRAAPAARRRFDVRVSDQREAPEWMREGARSDRRPARPRRGASGDAGCAHVVHLAAIVGGIANFHKLPHTLTEVNNALYNARRSRRARAGVERFVYVSSIAWSSSARRQFPTTEEHLGECPTPRSAYGFSKLAGEVLLRAAHDEHGLPLLDLPARSTPTGRARCPTTSRGSRTWSPT